MLWGYRVSRLSRWCSRTSTEDSYDGDPAVFVALAADLQDRAVIGAAQVADWARTICVDAQPGRRPGDDEGAVPLEPVGRSGSLRRCRHCGQRAVTDSGGQGFGQRLGLFPGGPIIGIRICRDHLGGEQEGAQDIPRRPAAAN